MLTVLFVDCTVVLCICSAMTTYTWIPNFKWMRLLEIGYRFPRFYYYGKCCKSLFFGYFSHKRNDANSYQSTVCTCTLLARIYYISFLISVYFRNVSFYLNNWFNLANWFIYLIWCKCPILFTNTHLKWNMLKAEVWWYYLFVYFSLFGTEYIYLSNIHGLVS